MSDQPVLECYPTESVWLPRIVPGRPQRAWMDAFHDRHAYRCLPLTMANTTGWEILSPGAVPSRSRQSCRAGADSARMPTHWHTRSHVPR